MDYQKLTIAFLDWLEQIQPTRIISPTHPNYVFYQYDVHFGHRITRPLNSDLLFETSDTFLSAYEQFITFLDDLKKYNSQTVSTGKFQSYLPSNEINKVVYTLQQVIGCICDSFEGVNQSRKRVGQLFESLIKLIIQQVGLTCEPRTIQIPIPNYPDHIMSYELDVVFSHSKAIIASETAFIHPFEIVGSIKTTSKDRLIRFSLINIY